MTQEPIEARQQNPLDATVTAVEQQIEILIDRLRGEMEALRSERANGRDVGKLLSELSQALTGAVRLKERLDDEQRKQAGIAIGGYALDLEESRVRVTRCLGRLASCCREG